MRITGYIGENRHGGRSELNCIVFGRISAGGPRLEASCTSTVSAADKLYLRSERTGETGRIELLGGTGMYEGIAGACRYEVVSVSPTVGVTTSECTWKR